VPRRSHRWTGSLAVACALLLLAFLVYAPALSAWFVGDDFFVLEISRPGPPWRRFLLPQYLFFGERFEAVQMHGRPFLLASFAVQQALSGLDPLPLRAFNVLALAVSAWLVWRIAREHLRTSTASAWLAAVLFVVHPEHIDGVAWIAGRGAPLSTALVLGALFLWLRGARFLAAGLFFLGLGVYELAVTFPALVLLFEGKRALRDPLLLGLIAADLAFCFLQVFFLSEVQRIGWTPASSIHALRHVFQLVCPFFDSPRFGFYNHAAKDFVKEHLGTMAALATVVIAGSLVLAVRARAALGSEQRRLLGATACALLPALAYGHFSPRTSMLASAFLALSMAAFLERRRSLALAYLLALGLATFDECCYWREGGEISRRIVSEAARGGTVDPPASLEKLVPLFPGPETLATALRVFPQGPPPP
jgi:hypothetical protein